MTARPSTATLAVGSVAAGLLAGALAAHAAGPGEPPGPPGAVVRVELDAVVPGPGHPTARLAVLARATGSGAVRLGPLVVSGGGLAAGQAAPADPAPLRPGDVRRTLVEVPLTCSGPTPPRVRASAEVREDGRDATGSPRGPAAATVVVTGVLRAAGGACAAATGPATTTTTIVATAGDGPGGALRVHLPALAPGTRLVAVRASGWFLSVAARDGADGTTQTALDRPATLTLAPPAPTCTDVRAAETAATTLDLLVTDADGRLGKAVVPVGPPLARWLLARTATACP